jgi:hypothetical protein
MNKNNNRKTAIQEWENKIDTVVNCYEKLTTEWQKWVELGMDVECPFANAIFTTFEKMLELVDVCGWLEWHIFENDCGKEGLSAAPYASKNMKKIKNNRDLAVVIVDFLDSFESEDQ